MMPLAMLLGRGEPPPPWFLLFVPLIFLGVSWLTNRLMGIPALYKDFPADREDPIEENLGWQQVEFGALRGHSPMSIKFGRRCLHLKQPFPFQPLYWQGPASIPWQDILLDKAARPEKWAFWSAAEFRLGPGGRLIRVRGKAGRRLQARLLKGHEGAAGTSSRPEPIRPR